MMDLPAPLVTALITRSLVSSMATAGLTGTDQASIDARQTLTCTNVKAAGVVLYTIQVNTDGEATSTLLRNCATDTSKFFLLTSANQIVTTFNQIGTNLSKLHIAK